MKKYLLIKIFMVFAINILFLLKYHNDGNLILISSLVTNIILFFTICFLYKNSSFLLFLKRYFGASSLFLIIGGIFVSIYYEEKSNDVGTLIILLTLNDIAFLLYFFTYNFLCKKINHQKTDEIIKELKKDIKFNNFSFNFHHYRLKSNYSDSNGYNPSSGLPMANSGFDVGGNAYGSYHR
ncbi:MULTISPECIES: hypothetical protein [Providencia]|uniref:hypothetical protein n=1 Tax=Providencia TaxID=586 RepID=UPI001E579DFD|nr:MULTISPECIES: hypothetical protein [Providencia]UEK61625.1 hypothetical protein LL668_21085 [Providencia rettgeri]UEK61638.1 hypothetical protein LL668_20305 [Providencia rettgeri]